MVDTKQFVRENEHQWLVSMKSETGSTSAEQSSTSLAGLQTERMQVGMDADTLHGRNTLKIASLVRCKVRIGISLFE
jgi:hypothetical protein